MLGKIPPGSFLMCKRINAEHSVKDDAAFLWKHGKFGYQPNIYPLIDLNEKLHDNFVGTICGLA
jgi:hypothetical protein